ncbi:hypothetical protein Tco_1296815 [Tanacetum coccineum]
MSLCTKLQKQVLDLEEAKTAQAKEIASLKKRVKQLEKRKKLRTSGLKRLRKVGSASRVESSNDVSLGDQEDASKQGRKIADLDANAEVTLIDETQERYDEEMLFDVQDDLQGEEVVAEKKVSAANPVTTAGEVVTIATATTTVDELTLAQTLMEIKAAKPKAVTTAAIRISTVVASTRPKAKGIIFHDQEEQVFAFTPIVSSSQLPQAKDKGNGKIVETKNPLKKKIKLHLIKNWHSDCMLKNKQTMIEADEQLAARLQAEEQEQFSIEEKSRISKTRTKGSSKRAGDELESDKSKKQKIDEHVEVEQKDNDQEEAEMKRHIEIVKDDEVAIDAIPLATKPPMIVEYTICYDQEKSRSLPIFTSQSS